MADTKTIVAFATAAILANGEYKESEKDAISSIAETLNINEKEMFDAIDSEIEKQEAMSDEDLNAYLIEMAKGLDENDMIEVFQICLSVTLADGILSKNETIILLTLADILNIDVVYATMMIAYSVNNATDLVVEIELDNIGGDK